MKKLIILIISLSIEIPAQQYIDSFGKFGNAVSLSINPAGNIFVADADENEIIKFDTLGNEMNKIGGYGWNPSAFDFPADVFASTLKIYVADKNNNRIQVFDKDLNFRYELTNEKTESEFYSFAYPIGCGVSNQGDFFILDSDNKRILKYNMTGGYLLEIGGTDAGSFALNEPKHFAVSNDGKVLVIDGNKIIVFDQYGTGLLKLAAEIEPKNINVTFSILTINNDTTIKFIDLSKRDAEFKTISFKNDLGDMHIKDSSIFNSKLYLLTSKTIFVYDLSAN